jgi:hypothetical protein
MASVVSRKHLITMAFAGALWLASSGLRPVLAQMSAAVAVSVEVGGPLELDTDSDGDGIPDYWEYENFYNSMTVSSNTDFDNDGFLDREEYLAGTDPKDPHSFLQLTGIQFLPDGHWLVAWDSSTSPVPRLRSYDVVAGDSVFDLARGGAVLLTNIATEGAETDFELPAMTVTQRYFRVKLHP